MRQPRTLSPAERAEALRSLRTVGGIYDHIALVVEHDLSEPKPHDSSTTNNEGA